jgi:putative ABC transport system permease protein
VDSHRVGNRPRAGGVRCFVARLLSVWRNLVHRTRVDRDLDEELRATLELLVDENLRSGMRPDEARRGARLTLGSLPSVKDQVGDVRAGAVVDAILQDVRYAWRQFRRAPGFSAVAVVTLALGIGANAAIFGVVKSVLLDPLPYDDAERLMRIYGRSLDGTPEWPPLTARVVQTITARQQSFDSLTAFDSVRDAVYGGDDVARIARLAWVEPGFFATLGVRAALGRTFVDGDRALGYVPASGAEVGPDTARVVVLSHAAWQGLFAADAAILGRNIRVNGLARTVIGVLPYDFAGPNGTADFYFAFDRQPALASGAGWLALAGRLKPGVTYDAARREIAGIWATRENPDQYRNVGMTAMPLREAMAGATRTPLLVLLASAGLVLLIACANLAGALLSRGLSRRREFGVRIALGAGRRRLAQQLLTESTVLAIAGGLAGLLLADVMLSLLRGLAGSVLPAYADLSLDAGAVVVTAAITLGTGFAFGLVPAIAIGRSESQGALRADERGASESRRPRMVRGVLVAAQLALCASLVAGAGLLAHSLWEMASAPLGFDAAGVLTARFRLSTRDYATLESRARFHTQLLDRLRVLPGVAAVAIAHKVPTVDPRRASLAVDGARPDVVPSIVLHASVSDDYFRTLRIPLRQGRTFDASDRAGAAATAVISDVMARRYWPAGGALGSRIHVDGDPMTVVGIVGDVRNDLARADAEPLVYRSHRQESTQRFCVLLRTGGDPLALVRPLAREVAALDASLPVQQAMTLDAAVGEGLAGHRLPVTLMTAFGALALLLASVGVYAMFASMAAAREREFGIRLALGSRPAAIVVLMLRQGAGWMGVGLIGGALGAVVVERLLRQLIEGVPPFDPVSLGLAAAIMLASATIALLVPMRRATRVDPIVALRAE